MYKNQKKMKKKEKKWNRDFINVEAFAKTFTLRLITLARLAGGSGIEK